MKVMPCNNLVVVVGHKQSVGCNITVSWPKMNDVIGKIVSEVSIKEGENLFYHIFCAAALFQLVCVGCDGSNASISLCAEEWKILS